MGYKHLSISSFLFQRGRFVSLFGMAGSGKTALSLQVLREVGRGIYLSTSGVSYEGRVRGKWDSLFVNVNSPFELFSAVVESPGKLPRIVVVDSVNRFFRMDRKHRPLLMTLNLLKSTPGKVLLTWDMSINNRVSGHKIMLYYSEDVFRTTGRYLIGNNVKCKFKIKSDGVEGCITS
ncbi:ATP-binding protein [Metallosphaera tengchongensis]|uniref:ATP-binding protein n=1 Tax=Metallosphaera tengchongensis TaxID=1532350 RepID=A0A6N0NTV0_9CREN|nr:ATP-binding protein [Metallosphaera tengchongensis]QKQ99594.1 ATP-binding protein [Metallosphaera tengchongensis]